MTGRAGSGAASFVDTLPSFNICNVVVVHVLGSTTADPTRQAIGTPKSNSVAKDPTQFSAAFHQWV